MMQRKKQRNIILLVLFVFLCFKYSPRVTRKGVDTTPVVILPVDTRKENKKTSNKLQGYDQHLISPPTITHIKRSPKQISSEKRQHQEDRKCEPVKNVIFLKTHKTASSTIINIMQRYSEVHNLTVALPNNLNFLGWPWRFKETHIFQHESGNKYNIICHHSRFSKEKMLNVMSDRKNTKIFTIIRDPLKQLQSLASYANLWKTFKLPNNLRFVEEFFKNETQRVEVMKRRGDGTLSLVKNPIAFDMGFSIWEDDSNNVSKILESVKRDFDLVLISERMVESLVLLKNELCWDLEDVTFFSHNKRSDKYRQLVNNKNKARDQIRRWSKIDSSLYDYFRRVFSERVHKGGIAFQEDVNKLLALNNKWQKRCIETIYSGKNVLLNYRIKKNIKGRKERATCMRMLRTEIPYTNYLKLRQTKYNWNPMKNAKIR